MNETSKETNIIYRCRKCRFLLDVSAAVIKSRTVCSVSSRTIDLDTDSCPAWIIEVINKAGWQKGKINCEKCAGRLGSFDFLKDHSCKGPSCVHQHSPVHILRDRVDEIDTGLMTTIVSTNYEGTTTHACSKPLLASTRFNPASGCTENLHFADQQLSNACLAQQQDILPTLKGRKSDTEGRGKGEAVVCGSIDNSEMVDNLSNDNLLENEMDKAIMRDFVPGKSRTSLEFLNRELRSRKQPKVKRREIGHEYPTEQSNSGTTLSLMQASHGTGTRRQKVNNRFMALECEDVSSAGEIEVPVSVKNLEECSSVPLKTNTTRKRLPRKKYRNRFPDLHQVDPYMTDLYSLPTPEEEEIPPEMCCPVCLEVLYSPYKCRPCDHTFCDICLRRIARNKPSFTSCPLCRKVIRTCVSDTDLAHKLKSNFPKQYQERYLESKKMNTKLFPLPRCTRRESFARNVHELLFDGTNRIWFLTYCLPILLLFSHISIALFIFLRTIWQSIRNSLL